ncbi:unnamed protein product [Somion occarium]|uniref:Uncharacterized protein n=1 Tax=Somion occarium TaxID=3059160 RepID=A0ABP1E6G1_9APHY
MQPPFERFRILTAPLELEHVNAQSRDLSRRIFNLRASSNPQLVERVEDLFKVYTDLQWVCRDIAGDLRTGAVDLRYAILSTLRDDGLEISLRLRILDSWITRMKTKRQHAVALPGYFQDLASAFRREAQGLKYSAPNDSETVPASSIVTQVSTWFGKKTNDRSGEYTRSSSSYTRLSGPSPTASVPRSQFSATSGVSLATKVSQGAARWTGVKQGLTLLQKLNKSSLSTIHSWGWEFGRNQNTRLQTTHSLMEIASALDSLGTDVEVFTEIYDQLFREIGKTRSSLSTATRKDDPAIILELNSLRPRLESYAHILEIYQKSV